MLSAATRFIQEGAHADRCTLLLTQVVVNALVSLLESGSLLHLQPRSNSSSSTSGSKAAHLHVVREYVLSLACSGRVRVKPSFVLLLLKQLVEDAAAAAAEAAAAPQGSNTYRAAAVARAHAEERFVQLIEETGINVAGQPLDRDKLGAQVGEQVPAVSLENAILMCMACVCPTGCSGVQHCAVWVVLCFAKQGQHALCDSVPPHPCMPCSPGKCLAPARSLTAMPSSFTNSASLPPASCLTAALPCHQEAAQAQELAASAGFLSASAAIHHQLGNFSAALKCHLQRHAAAPRAVFDYAHRHLSLRLTSAQRQQFTRSIMQHAAALVAADPQATAALVSQHMAQEQIPMLKQLESQPQLQFDLLNAIMQLESAARHALTEESAAMDAPPGTAMAPGSSSHTTSSSSDAAGAAGGGASKRQGLLDRPEVVDMYIQLLTKFQPGAVLRFLQGHEGYNVQAAVKLCQAAGAPCRRLASGSACLAVVLEGVAGHSSSISNRTAAVAATLQCAVPCMVRQCIVPCTCHAAAEGCIHQQLYKSSCWWKKQLDFHSLHNCCGSQCS
jgi:hypothetical protein